MSDVASIGAGFSGLGAAAYLSGAGHKVTVYEKNATPGGRARQFKSDNGYVFDMGPSWYWMPDIFEQFFNDFGYRTSDFYELELLVPSFDMVLEDQVVRIPSNYDELRRVFETIEAGSAAKLDDFMLQAEYKYNKGMKEFAQLPGLSLTEFL